MKDKKKDEVPAIEPPCADCVHTRQETGGKQMWCARHAEKHARAHGWEYQREHRLGMHDSEVEPTGIDSSRIR
jgi:hypothetical protein